MKVQVGHLYRADGSFEVVRPGNGKKFTLAELQQAVGGYIQRLESGVKGCRTMYCNEDGIALNLPLNPHTWKVVNAPIYERSVLPDGTKMYPKEWRVRGNIFAVLTESGSEDKRN